MTTLRTYWTTNTEGEPELTNETIETPAPNFDQRVTAAEKAFEDEARKAFGILDHAQGERPRWLYPRAVAKAIEHVNTAAAILRDYARQSA